MIKLRSYINILTLFSILKKYCIFLCIATYMMLYAIDLHSQGMLFLHKIKTVHVNDTSKNDSLYRSGLYHYDKKNYRMALSNFLRIKKEHLTNAGLYYNTGVCYIYSYPKYQALPYFQKAYELNKHVNDNIFYYLGLAHHINGNFNEAINYYFSFLSTATTINEKFDVQKKINECQNGLLFMEDTSSKYIIENLGDSVNSDLPEYRPVVNNDNRNIYFTVAKPIYIKDIEKERNYEDVYTSFFENGHWSKRIKADFEQKVLGSEAVAGTSEDKRKLFIYDGSKNFGDILLFDWSSYKLSNPRYLPERINTIHKESSATLNRKEDTLFFVSSHPDESYGGKDIYMSVKKEAGWDVPVNLGPVINTRYDEDAVYYDSDKKTIYFSSKGHNTMGGYDIFKSKYDTINKQWTTPVNMGFPINSPSDDLFFSFTEDKKYAYFSSVKNDTRGSQDIYRARFKAEPKPLKNTDTTKKEIGEVKEKQKIDFYKVKFKLEENDENIKINTQQEFILPPKEQYNIHIKDNE